MRSLLWAAAISRLALLLWGEWQDAHLQVNYTDIDYDVYTDAARAILAGAHPYSRSTYRYTPLLALVLTPNVFLHRVFGKVLFSAADLLAARLMQQQLRHSGATPRMQTLAVAVWLFSPFTATISTRGNGEALVTCMLLGMLGCLRLGQDILAGLLFGLAVHWRLYPIIFALPLVRHLAMQHQATIACTAPAAQPPSRLLCTARSVVSPAGVRFGCAATGVFLGLGALMYSWCGHAFLHETYLYHASRVDPRHNFSPYFYPAYLATGKVAPAGSQSGAGGLLGDGGWAFAAAQVVLQAALGWRFAGTLPMCLLLQTVALVGFNKVVTAQYFVWYLSFLPLVLPQLTKAQNKRHLVVAAAAWVAAMSHWLGWAYQLEFRGEAVHAVVWAASLAFLMAHVLLLRELIIAAQNAHP